MRKAKLERKQRREELKRLKEALGQEHADHQVGYKPAVFKGDDFGNISVSEMSDIQEQNENIDRNEAIQRGPAEAAQHKRLLINEFDHALKGPSQNQQLGMRKQIDFKLRMEKDAHQNLARPTPVDMLIEEVDAIMKQDEPEEWKETDVKTKLRRRFIDSKVPEIDPIIALHNRLAKIPDHDVKFKKKKKKMIERHDPKALRILPDYD